MRKNRHLSVQVLATVLALAAQSASHAQQYPTRPIRMLVPFTAGSYTDTVARMVGQKMVEHWGQQVVVDNRPSGGGVVASQVVAGSNPDGHTLMMVSVGHAASATLYAKLPYDVLRDFAGVSQVVSGPAVLVAGKDLGVKSLKELIALARSKPGQLNYASAGIGSGAHINGEMFKLEAGIAVTHVPYKGAPDALGDVMTGRVQYTFLSPPVAAPFIRDGRVLALGVTTLARSPMLPGVPSFSEAGVPGYEFDQWYGLVAPARTPRSVVNQLSAEVARILTLPDVRERMLSGGASPKSSTPEAFDAFIRAEVQKLGKVIKAANVQIE